jgi:RND family efflux transporter MFP subunit
MRRAFSSLLALSALMMSSQACGRSAPEEVETQSVVPVMTAPVLTGSVRGVVHATGVVTPAPGADLVVIAPQPGRIVEVPKAEGDRVRRGDLLVRFEIPDIAAESASKVAEVTRARARVKNAQAAQARAHDLFDRGVAARKEVEDADREMADAEAALGEAVAAQAAAEVVARRTAVHATFDGVVAKRSHNPGDLVEAAASDPVLRVIDPHRLEVTALLPLFEIPRLVVGAAARVSSAADAKPKEMKVISRPAVVDSDTAAAPVRLAFVEETGYPAGLPVQVDIDAELHTNALVVPVEAIVREGGATAVFVTADGKAQRRAVVTGLADGRQVEVLSGVKAGESVIVKGQTGLPDGAAVTATAAAK